jgi:hypothetical protein
MFKVQGSKFKFVGWAEQSEAQHLSLPPDCPIKHNLFFRTPVRMISPVFYISVKAGIFPIHRGFCQPVLHRIVMYIIDMPHIILIVADLVLPKPALPNALLSFLNSAVIRDFSNRIGACSCKFAFDQHPSCRKIVISLRQCPDAVKVIR